MNIFRRFFLTVFLFMFVICGCCEEKIFRQSSEGYDYNDILVTRVVDGDTFEIKNGKRVRLIGIDAPEVHFSGRLSRQAKRAQKDAETIKILGEEAWLFARKLVEGKKVRLEFDVDKYDKYERLLANVYLKDGTFVNKEIIKEGYALLYTVPPNVKYKDILLEALKEARREKKGLWKE